MSRNRDLPFEHRSRIGELWSAIYPQYGATVLPIIIDAFTALERPLTIGG